MITLFHQDDSPSLTAESRFAFVCGPQMPCFNLCCQAGIIVLNPGDVLRLKRFLKVSSTEFLRRYTMRETEAGSGLPLVFLKPPRGQETGCIFVTEAGCAVYEARPDACRLFPVAQGSKLGPEGPRDYLYLRRPPYCHGLTADREWTIAQWMASQGFDPDDPRRRAWVSLLLTRTLSGAATPDQEDLFYLAAYDLDNFRTFVLTSAFPRVYSFPQEALAPLAEDDESLLRFALAYITATLENDEPSLVREALREALLTEVPG